MMGIVVPETCWAYKKYIKISGILLVFILQLAALVAGVIAYSVNLGVEYEV